MDSAGLFSAIRKSRSYLCIGLDPEIEKMPPHIRAMEEPVFEFNKRIIEATQEYAVAYKPNVAFYESLGIPGWEALEKTARFIRETYPGKFIIADAKRADIGNTSRMYAKTFLGSLPFDAVTVAPYMGEDSVTPFLSYPGKWVVLLALTSNAGAADFQYHNENGQKMFEKVIETSSRWGTPDNMMYVAGATRAEMLKEIRKLVPDHFLLVPGVGAQGGSLAEVSLNGLNSRCGLLVNSSRAIIFADSTENFAKVASTKAREMQKEMENYLSAMKLI